ncbi:MAG: T9SS type A sorting domain-containing protein, partial [Bacteroidales bacterium]|nr:T9SS type A sorting domain-containing protein [Bacteroidales bacterium]
PTITNSKIEVEVPKRNDGNLGLGTFAVVGNPFMSSISYSSFALNNTGLNLTGYYAWDGTAKVFGTGLDAIAPLQGFVIYNSTGGDVTDELDKFTLTFPIGLATGSGLGTLKSAQETAQMTVSASNSAGTARTIILNKDNGGTVFNGIVDLPKLMSSINTLPDLYTLKPSTTGSSVALGINVVNTNSITIPLAIHTSYTGAITLSFSGMDAWDAVVSLCENGVPVADLTGKASCDYTFDYAPTLVDGKPVANESRFSISLSPAVTTDAAGTAAAAPVAVYSRDGAIHAISSAANPIVSVSVYTLQGALVSTAAVNAPVYTAKAPQGVCIVKVVTGQGAQTVKLVISD